MGKLEITSPMLGMRGWERGRDLSSRAEARGQRRARHLAPHELQGAAP